MSSASGTTSEPPYRAHTRMQKLFALHREACQDRCYAATNKRCNMVTSRDDVSTVASMFVVPIHYERARHDVVPTLSACASCSDMTSAPPFQPFVSGESSALAEFFSCCGTIAATPMLYQRSTAEAFGSKVRELMAVFEALPPEVDKEPLLQSLQPC